MAPTSNAFLTTAGVGSPQHQQPPPIDPHHRIWVRRPAGAATTVAVTPGDIVDDLKSALIVKYAASLGRFHDAPDLQIRMRMAAAHANSSNSSSNNSSRRRRRGDVVRRELALLEEQQQQHQHQHNAVYDDEERVLQPDEVLQGILDKFYPTGMRMSDAFIVDVPEDHVSTQALASRDLQQQQQIFRGAGVQRQHLQATLGAGAFDYTSDDELAAVRQQFNVSTQSLPDAAMFHSHGSPLAGGAPPGRFHEDERHGHTHARTSSADAYAAGQRIPGRSRQGGHSPTARVPSSLANSVVTSQHTTSNGSSRPQPQPIQHHLLDGVHLHSSSSPEDAAHGTKSRTGGNGGTGGTTIGKLPLQNAPMNGADNIDDGHRKNGDLNKLDVDSGTPENSNSVTPVGTVTASPNGSSSVSSASSSQPPSNTATQFKPRTRGKNDKSPSLPASLLDGLVPPIKVLIVEDNPINQMILETFMRKRHIRSNVAKNGREAIEKWREGGYHLVLMDIQLPVLSGIEATKEIRRLERRNRIGVFVDKEGGIIKAEDVLPPHRFKSPVIIVALTASSLDSDRREALAAGCNDFLIKPVSLEWLQRKITEWGCMQALIDFEGWRQWKGTDEDGNGGQILSASSSVTNLSTNSNGNWRRNKSSSRQKGG
ncbi:uncharacterized protein V1518DRAFT_375132 [Limtongia smithiae]|uniref:uncharacterized protein n=1 Tax=Limtongia smithiae TaxID=1125753 RepID=UPI0034CFCB8E